MSQPIIEVENLSKCYRIGANKEPYLSLRDEVAKFVSSLRPRSKNKRQPEQDFWALNDVSFSVQEGEAVGIIGRNGAGKSTLLKILSQITPPTNGKITMRGRVASLLEVGTGFHPELTGRENIFLNGAILGMSRAEISRKFDEIVAFAEIEKFLDTPVKRYSSGMYVRLAFAVAAHLEPEILVVDEVLAVGDAEFQKKCLGKMSEVAKGGRTVLFVSHNMAAVQQLCKSCIVLKSGELIHQGDVSETIRCYLGQQNVGNEIVSHISKSNQLINVTSVKVNGSTTDEVNLEPNQYILHVEIIGEIYEPLRMDLEVRIFDYQSFPLAFFSLGHERGSTEITPAGKFIITRHIKLPRMMRGSYSASIAITHPGIKYWVDIPGAVIINSPGTSTATGLVFDYKDSNGWVLLSHKP